MLLLTLGLGLAVWLVMGASQERELRRIFSERLALELEQQARRDRELFDERVQWIHHAAKLVVTQKRFMDYVASPAFMSGAPPGGEEGYREGDITHYETPPTWMPGSSVLRAFFVARHALLLDAEGRVREIYHHIPHRNDRDIPMALIEPSVLLRKLSHNQSYMTDIEGVPYVITARQVKDRDGRVLATLMLESPINDEFLSGVGGAQQDEHVIALVRTNSGVVVSSSSPGRIAAGSTVEKLKSRYLMMGKSFFDYGSSDLQLQFTSFMALERAAQMANLVLAKSHQQRILMVAVLVGVFALLITLVGARIRLLTRQVVALSHDRLGGGSGSSGHGDEVAVLEEQFHDLGAAIDGYQERLEREAQERIELNLRAVAGEHHAQELQRVKSLMEELGFGIILTHRNGLSPFNERMEHYAKSFGGLHHFLLEPGDEGLERTLVDHDGEERVFTITPYQVMEEEMILVHEITEQRRAEAELHVFSSLPASNPNPVLRVGLDGVIQYANAASAQMMGICDCEVGHRLPARWLESLERSMGEGQMAPIEVQVGERSYAFIPALIDGSNFLYLYGRDVTEAKSAERQLSMAAAVAENVLDAIIVTDRNGVITQVNPAFSEITGFSAGEVVGKTPRVLKSYHHDEVFYQNLWRSLIVDSQWRGELWNRRKNGEIFPCLMSIRAIRDDDGQIASYVSVFADISERKAREQRLSELAYIDALTGLPNRVLLMDRVGQAVAHAARNRLQVALLFLDLDGFKAVNDTLGHDVGDLLLQEVARRLQAEVRDSDTVCRLGGDEFVAVLPDFSDEQILGTLAEKICKGLSAPYEFDGRMAHVSASVGIALYPRDGSSPEELMKLADAAMYQAKRAGKNGYHFYRPASVTPLPQRKE